MQISTTYTQGMRIHVSGDFYSEEYIQNWIDIVNGCPSVQFYAYTRSWNTPMLGKLEELRALPNIQLLASVDQTMPMPPIGWRVAYMATDSRFRGMRCLVQQHSKLCAPNCDGKKHKTGPTHIGKLPDCKACGACFIKTLGNIEFAIH